MPNEVISESLTKNRKKINTAYLNEAFLKIEKYPLLFKIFISRKEKIYKSLNDYNLTYNPILKLNLFNEKEKLNAIEEIINDYNLYEDKDFCKKITSLDYNEARGVYAELVFIKQIKNNENANIKVIEKNKVKTNDFEIQFENETYNIELTTNLMGEAEENIRKGFRKFIECLNEKPQLKNKAITLRVNADKLKENENEKYDSNLVYKILKDEFNIIEDVIIKERYFNLNKFNKEEREKLALKLNNTNKKKTFNDFAIKSGELKNEPNSSRCNNIETINISPSVAENLRVDYILKSIICKLKTKICKNQLKNKTNGILVITSDDHIFENDFNSIIQHPCFILCVKKLIENTTLLGIYIYQEKVIDGVFISNNQEEVTNNKILALLENKTLILTNLCDYDFSISFFSIATSFDSLKSIRNINNTIIHKFLQICRIII